MYVDIKGIEKSYGENGYKSKVIKGIDLEIKEGEICAILGPSGSGKSTLLNLIGGLDSGDAGTITIDGMEISKMKPKELVEYRRKYLGFVFQMYNLVSNLSAEENIRTAEFLTDEPMDLSRIMKVLGLEGHEKKFPSQLSGGQQQRCSIGRGIIKKPKLLLCDEPTGALDYKSSKDILVLLSEINKEFGTTIIMVTHNEAIQEMCHKTILLKDGQIVQIKERKNLKSARELEW